jgi:hypothetical protein
VGVGLPIIAEEDDMSPRKPTIDDLDDVDDEDGVLEEEAAQETDLDLTVEDAERVALGGLPPELDPEMNSEEEEEEER